MPDEFQARQAIPAILEVAASTTQQKNNEKKKKNVCVYARMWYVCVCLHVIMKESAEWQACQTILQVSSSKHNTPINKEKKEHMCVCVFVCVCACMSL